MRYSRTLFHAWIPDVEEITLDPAHPDQNKPGYLLQISVRTARGESFDFLLHAQKKEKLEFRDPPVLDDEDWEEPRIYTPDEDKA